MAIEVAASSLAAAGVTGQPAIAAGVGELKRMWVHDDWRGAGLGTRLLRHLENRCRELGHGIVRLDTNAALAEAITMYHRVGYRAIPRYNDNPWATNFFEKKSKRQKPRVRCVAPSARLRACERIVAESLDGAERRAAAAGISQILRQAETVTA